MTDKMGFNERRVTFDWHNQPVEAFGYRFKSKQEYKWAQYLEYLKMSDEVDTWQYEPHTFEMKERYRKRRIYTPDFKVYTVTRYAHIRYVQHEWHEVKTTLRQKDVTRFRYFKADYPNERIVLVITSKPRTTKRIVLLEKAKKYVDDVIFAGPIFRKLGL